MVLRSSNEILSEYHTQSIVTFSVIQSRVQYHILRPNSLNEPRVAIVYLPPSLGASISTGTNAAASSHINIREANHIVP